MLTPAAQAAVCLPLGVLAAALLVVLVRVAVTRSGTRRAAHAQAYAEQAVADVTRHDPAARAAFLLLLADRLHAEGIDPADVTLDGATLCDAFGRARSDAESAADARPSTSW